MRERWRRRLSKTDALYAARQEETSELMYFGNQHRSRSPPGDMTMAKVEWARAEIMANQGKEN